MIPFPNHLFQEPAPAREALRAIALAALGAAGALGCRGESAGGLGSPMARVGTGKRAEAQRGIWSLIPPEVEE